MNWDFDNHYFRILVPGIAGLTVGIRQLVITNIMGRRFSGGHVFNSDQAIYQDLLGIIGGDADAYDEYEDDEEKMQVFTENRISEKFSAERKTGRAVCYSRLGVCLTRSVLMSLKDLPSEGVVLGGLLGAALEILMTGSMKNAWEGLAKVDHVRHTRSCLLDHSTC